MAKKLTEPSDKQLEIYKLIIDTIQEHGYQPSQQELAEALNVTRRAVVERLKNLEEHGLIDMNYGKERAVKLKFVHFQAIFKNQS